MEEKMNAITHGTGALLAFAGLILLVVSAAISGSIWHIVSFSVYGASLFLLYLASTLYHSFHAKRVKAILKIVDHSAIYLLIAGTYTPFTLVLLHGRLGWTLFGIIWGLAAIGITLKIFFSTQFRFASTLFYIVMGWLLLVVIQPISTSLPPAGLYWLLAGGILYTAGTVFYLWRRLPYNHAVWHIFVLAGSTAHFITIFFYLLPISVPN